jgi:hypothetical protein
VRSSSENWSALCANAASMNGMSEICRCNSGTTAHLRRAAESCRAITQWSVHLRRTLHNVFRTWPSLRLDSASFNFTMCLDKMRFIECNVSSHGLPKG